MYGTLNRRPTICETVTTYIRPTSGDDVNETVAINAALNLLVNTR